MSTAKPDHKKIKILCTQGSKGGVGKTFTAAQLVSWLKSKNVPFVALDLDNENKDRGGLESYCPEAKKTNTDNLTGLDVLLDMAETSDVSLLVVDMAAASGDKLFAWFNELYGAFDQYDVEFVFICMITSDPSTVSNTLIWANELKKRVRYIIVKNPLENSAPTFEFWSDEIEQVHQFKQAFQPVEIVLPHVRPEIAAHLVNSRLTLHAALESDRSALPPELRSFKTQYRIKVLRDAVFAAFESIERELLP